MLACEAVFDNPVSEEVDSGTVLSERGGHAFHAREVGVTDADMILQAAVLEAMI